MDDRGYHIVDVGKVAAAVSGRAEIADAPGLQQPSQPCGPLRTAGPEDAGWSQDDRIAAVVDVFPDDALALDLGLAVAADRRHGRVIFPHQAGRGAVDG